MLRGLCPSLPAPCRCALRKEPGAADTQQPKAGVMVEALGYPMPHMLPSPACSPGAWVGASGFIPEQGFGQLGSSGGSRRVPAALAGGIGSALLTHPCPTELCQGLQSAELNPGLQTPHFGVSLGVFFFFMFTPCPGRRPRAALGARAERWCLPQPLSQRSPQAVLGCLGETAYSCLCWKGIFYLSPR